MFETNCVLNFVGPHMATKTSHMRLMFESTT